MKYRTFERFSLTSLALAALAAMGGDAWALGLGRLNVQSALGEPLQAEIEIISITPDEAGSLSVRIATPEVYRTAGVDYSAILASTQGS